MITRLGIQGLAIIESLSIEFSPGFNVITGETGAGKSILIRALGFLMGAKAGADAVRKGCDQATVIGEFAVPRGHAALEVMTRLGVPYEESAEVSILIRRQLTAKGRSQSWVNDVNLTSPSLRELGLTLVDVFGQHENQRLMETPRHSDYLDAFLEDSGLRDKVADLSRACSDTLGEIQDLVDKVQDRGRQGDYLSFRLEELREFKPSREDFESIESYVKLSEQSVVLRESLSRALRCLEGEGDEGVGKAIWEASRLLGQAASQSSEEAGRLQTFHDRAAHAATEIDDLTFEIGKILSRFDTDEGELESAQERLFGYQTLFRKHTVRDIEGLLAESERLETELGSLEHAAEKLGELTLDLRARAQALAKAAASLSKARKEAAERLKGKVEKELHELAMPGARFAAEFTPFDRALSPVDLAPYGEAAVKAYADSATVLKTVGETGAEKVQFLLASNPGEPILPLARVASGGELSRVLLALKKSLAADAETCVLVFDEVDTGVSGRVADVVGHKIRELAATFQVICISHLPQVAVYADSHFLVKKESRGERTESSIVRLSREESAREIARLLSGAEVSTPSLANAKALIERARGKVKTKSRVDAQA